MTRILTGDTVFELVESVDADNHPITGATFNSAFYFNGNINTGITLNISLADPVRAIFVASFSGATFGYYQFQLVNNITNVIYVSDNYKVSPSDEIIASPTIYVGF